jgi:hypothetical protein
MRQLNAQAILARLDRVSVEAQANCGRDHVQITHDIGGCEPMAQSKAVTTERCRCGAAMTSLRIIHERAEGDQICAG